LRHLIPSRTTRITRPILLGGVGLAIRSSL